MLILFCNKKTAPRRGGITLRIFIENVACLVEYAPEPFVGWSHIEPAYLSAVLVAKQTAVARPLVAHCDKPQLAEMSSTQFAGSSLG